MELVISVRRSHREQISADWMEQVLHTEGVTTISGPLFGRITVDATPEARSRLERDLGDRLIIEPILRHDTQRSDKGQGD